MVAPICDFIVKGLSVVLIQTLCFHIFLTQWKKFIPVPDSAYKPGLMFSNIKIKIYYSHIHKEIETGYWMNSAKDYLL